MDPIRRFSEYAAAFEKAYANDDWSVLEPYFTEDAVYETFADPPLAGRAEGRDEVLAYFQRSVNGFDRRYSTREVEVLEGPELRDGAVWIRWRARYRLPNPEAEPLVIGGEERAWLEGDRIRRLEDRFEPDTGRRAVEHMGAHAGQLRSAGGAESGADSGSGSEPAGG